MPPEMSSVSSKTSSLSNQINSARSRESDTSTDELLQQWKGQKTIPCQPKMLRKEIQVKYQT